MKRRAVIIYRCAGCNQDIYYPLAPAKETMLEDCLTDAWRKAQRSAPLRHPCKPDEMGFAYPIRIKMEVVAE